MLLLDSEKAPAGAVVALAVLCQLVSGRRQALVPSNGQFDCRGSHYLARYISFKNIYKAFGKKRGHLLGNATSLPPWLFLLEQKVGHGGGGGWALKILLPIVGI